MSQESILAVEKLGKRFGDKTVLQDVSFTAIEGEIVGFVGQNGSGKTTTIKIIIGLMEKTAGEVTVCGEKVKYGRVGTNRHIGYLPDVPEFYNYMRPKEYLTLHAKIAGIDKANRAARVDELMELVGLGTNKKIGTFSRGMKQRLGVAQALVSRPKLLICDEPTSALDPMGRHELLNTFQRIKHETTVVFSTHILSDVERISDKVVILHEGSIKYTGSIDALKDRYTKIDKVLIVLPSPEDAKKLTAALGGKVDSHNGNEVVVRCSYESEEFYSLIKNIEQAGVVPRKIEMSEPDLEELFVEMAS